MHDRSLASVAVLAAIGAIVLVATGLLTAQSREAAGLWTTPRTAWGDPDLLGVWDYRTVTPLERPGNLADKEFLTDEEVASVEQLASETGITRDKDKREGLSAQEDLLYAYNDFWWDWGTKVASGGPHVVDSSCRQTGVCRLSRRRRRRRPPPAVRRGRPGLPVRGRTSAWQRGVCLA